MHSDNSTQKTMLNFDLEDLKKNFRNRFMESFTRANLITLVLWLAISLSDRLFHLVLWLKMFAVIFALLLSGFIADLLWLVWLSKRLERPYGLLGYLTRIPLYTLITPLIIFPVSITLQWPENQPWPQIAAIGIQWLYQIFNQWHHFNYVRKMSVNQL